MKYFLHILLLLLLTILIFWYNDTYEEAFVPTIIKESYRPLERNVKRNMSEVYNKSATIVSNMFRRLRLI